MLIHECSQEKLSYACVRKLAHMCRHITLVSACTCACDVVVSVGMDACMCFCESLVCVLLAYGCACECIPACDVGEVAWMHLGMQPAWYGEHMRGLMHTFKISSTAS